MAVTIRLRKPGKVANKKYNFRIVVCDERSARDSKFIEEIGYYSPNSKQPTGSVKINKERFQYWLSQGARPSDTVKSLVKKYK